MNVEGPQERVPAIPAATLGLLALLCVATLGQGGAEPTSQLVWHAGVLALVLVELLRGPATAPISRPAWLPLVFLGLYLLVAWVGAFFAPYGFAAWLFLLDLGSFAVVVWLAARRGPAFLTRLTLPLLVAAALPSASPPAVVESSKETSTPGIGVFAVSVTRKLTVVFSLRC